MATCTLRSEVNDGISAISQRLWSKWMARSFHANCWMKYVASRWSKFIFQLPATKGIRFDVMIIVTPIHIQLDENLVQCHCMRSMQKGASPFDDEEAPLS